MTAPIATDLLVVGAGPAGAAAAAWSARHGLDVVLADAATFPRDKTCGDGLTPRAVAELDRLGLGDWVRGHTVNRGLRGSGFGNELLLPWPGGSLPDHGSAVPRTEFDERIFRTAVDAGAQPLQGARAVDVTRSGDRITAVTFQVGSRRDGGRTERTVSCRRVIVADGVRSPLGRLLGREWHRETVYGVAGRCYVKSSFSDDPWISSHLELRDPEGALLPGYGWIFPLGDGEVNLGVGALSTAKRPASLQLKPLMEYYASLRRSEWQLGADLRMPTSAMLPMGGAVSGVSGANWLLVGDAAGCVNPLNGEGIDYGLETGREAAELLAIGDDPHTAWPSLLGSRYGESFSIARRLAGLLTLPRLLPTLGPVGMSSRAVMAVVFRLMGNLVTDADRDLVARIWRRAGRWSANRDARPPFSG